jgi:hypothetical protein
MEEETKPYSKFPVKDTTTRHSLSGVSLIEPFSFLFSRLKEPIHPRVGKKAEHRACAQCVSILHINLTPVTKGSLPSFPTYLGIS